MISENLSSLNGKSVQDYDVKTGIKNPESVVYRLRTDYDSFSDGGDIPSMIQQFCSDPNAPKVEELIIGAFDFDGGDSEDLVKALAESAARLPQLKALFIGDITYEENEISWINQSDVSSILKAYPKLEYFRVRGGNGLSFGEPFEHQGLRFLIVESGGLPPGVIAEVNSAKLPNLEHLELWLGSENYGFDSEADDFGPILSGANFPRLRYLGLRDSEIADELAAALEKATVLSRLETLDLSMGTLSDKGGEALLRNPAIRKLRMLDLHHHYLSDKVSQQLTQLGISVNLDDKKDEDEGERYIEVAE